MVRRAKILIYLLAAFFVSLETQAKNPPPGTGTSDIPANILIMLDNSGSMRAALSSANSLHYPEDVAVDSNGNIYILESSYRRIKKFDSDLNYIKSFGGSGTGCNKWSYAYEIDIYDDKLYIHDAIQSTWSNIRQVKELTLDGQCTGKNFAYAPKFGGRTGFTTGITASQDYVFVTVNKWGYMGVTVYNRYSDGYIGFYS